MNPSLVKALDNLVSVKFFVVCITTWLFYIGKLNQDGWITAVLSVTGMRLANEVAGMYKEIRTSSVAKAGKK